MKHASNCGIHTYQICTCGTFQRAELLGQKIESRDYNVHRQRLRLIAAIDAVDTEYRRDLAAMCAVAANCLITPIGELG